MTEKIEKMTLEAVSRVTEAEKKLEAQKNKSSAAAKAAGRYHQVHKQIHLAAAL